jgi:hypothetical protein
VNSYAEIQIEFSKIQNISDEKFFDIQRTLILDYSIKNSETDKITINVYKELHKGIRKLYGQGMGMFFFTYQNESKEKLFKEIVTMSKVSYLHIVPPFTSFSFNP